MTLSDSKNIIYFVADGVSNPEFIHLHNTYISIIKRDDVVLISINNKIDLNDKSFLESYGISKVIRKISEIDLNLSESSLIFPNTSSLPKGIKDFNRSKTGCFIGGCKSKDTIQKQIKSATSLDINFLFSDLLPTEVSNFINKEELTFFCKRINFIQPSFNESVQLCDNTKEKFLFLFQTNEKETQRSYKSILHKVLSKTEHCRVVNLDLLEVRNWFSGAIPGKSCRKVITDAIDPIFYNYLYELCSKRRIELINLWGSSTASPERFFIYASNTTSNWFDSTEIKPSLRSLITNILHEKGATEQDKDLPQRNNSSYRSDLKIISNFASEMNMSKDFSKEISENIIKANFHDTLSSDLYISAINHNSNTIKEYSSKIIYDSVNHLIHANDIEDIPEQIIDALFCDSLIRTYNKEIKQDGYLFLFNLFNTSNKHFLKSISQILNGNHLKTNPAGVLASVQKILQNHVSDKGTRKNAFLQLVSIIDSVLIRSSGADKEALNRVLARILLSLDDLPRYEQITAKCIKSKTKGVIGESVYYKLMEDLNHKFEELEYFHNACKTEKDSGLETITTQQSIFIIKILKGETEGILEGIFNPENPSADFTKMTWFMFQLSLISLLSKQKDIAQSIISKISLSKIKNSNYGMVSFVALKILTGNHDKFDDANLPIDISRDYIPSILQSERLTHPYFLFFFLEVIFIASSNKDGVKFTNYHRSLLPYVNKSYFNKVLDSVPSIGGNGSFLESYSKHLYENLPTQESSIIQLFNFGREI